MVSMQLGDALSVTDCFHAAWECSVVEGSLAVWRCSVSYKLCRLGIICLFQTVSMQLEDALLQTISMQLRDVLPVPDSFHAALGCYVCQAVSMQLGDALSVTKCFYATWGCCVYYRLVPCSLEMLSLCLLQTTSKQLGDALLQMVPIGDAVSFTDSFHAAWEFFVC